MDPAGAATDRRSARDRDPAKRETRRAAGDIGGADPAGHRERLAMPEEAGGSPRIVKVRRLESDEDA